MAVPRDLVYALCHEVGNLLAAQRLQCQLLDDEETGARISELAARAGSLLALVRPLLEARPVPVAGVEPLEILDSVRRGLQDPEDRRLRVRLKTAVDLPDVAVEAETLLHLLLVQLFAAFEDLPEGERLVLFAERRNNAVAFVLEDAGKPQDRQSGSRLAGRPLTQELARNILERCGGGCELELPAERTRVALLVPMVER
jgi:hypothetical protein